jgi:hypothetical protein
MSDGATPAMATLAETRSLSPSYLLYGFAPSSTVTLTLSGPRSSETSDVQVSPFGAVFDTIPTTRSPGGYTISVQYPGGVITVAVRKEGAGQRGDAR